VYCEKLVRKCFTSTPLTKMGGTKNKTLLRSYYFHLGWINNNKPIYITKDHKNAFQKKIKK
jgi:hypothetical protein